MASELPPGPSVRTVAAREAARTYREAGAGRMKLGARGPAVVAISMPLPWMAEGFLRAAHRVEEVDVPGDVETKDACMPLFEAFSWLHAIKEIYAPTSLDRNSDVRALRFIRNRQHHHSALPFDAARVSISGCGTGPGRSRNRDARTIPRPRRGKPRISGISIERASVSSRSSLLTSPSGESFCASQ
jgi:hypothetical protein